MPKAEAPFSLEALDNVLAEAELSAVRAHNVGDLREAVARLIECAAPSWSCSGHEDFVFWAWDPEDCNPLGPFQPSSRDLYLCHQEHHPRSDICFFVADAEKIRLFGSDSYDTCWESNYNLEVLFEDYPPGYMPWVPRGEQPDAVDYEPDVWEDDQPNADWLYADYQHWLAVKAVTAFLTQGARPDD